MNIAWVVLITVPALALAYRFYGRAVARWLGEDRSCPTPAVLFKDDKDFVPTRPSVLFGHHFATIAGAGPILECVRAYCTLGEMCDVLRGVFGEYEPIVTV
jgi:carbon starvation protein